MTVFIVLADIDPMPTHQQEIKEQASLETKTVVEGSVIDDRSSEDTQSVLGGQWRLLSDQVMGGVSVGSMMVTEREGRPCLQLKGQVSTQNNGGFLQLSLDLNQGKPLDARSFEGIKLDVLGNDERYNLHLRTTGLWFPWQSYRSSFTASPKWNTITLPFSEFQAYKTSRHFDPATITRIGLVAIGQDYEADVCLGSLRFY